jgi:hypothetical protein
MKVVMNPELEFFGEGAQVAVEEVSKTENSFDNT